MSKTKPTKDKNNELRTLAKAWHARAALSANFHYAAADYYISKHFYWTIGNVAAAIFVLFLANKSLLGFINSLESSISSFSVWFDVLAAIAALVVVVTTVVQYVMRFESVSSKHKTCANEYSNIKRKVERLILSDEIDVLSIHRVSDSLNWLGKCSPLVPRWLIQKVLNNVEGRSKFRENGITDIEKAEEELAAIIDKLDR